MTGAGHNHGNEARRFVRSQQSGVLSTFSQRLEGFPFGSVAPFVLDHAGCPVILISTLAEHTKNLDADPRCSLIVQPYSPDMQVVGRTTVIGKATHLVDKDALGPRYLRYHPQAEAYFAMHDFHFYRIEPVRVRWIGGFGKIHWVEPGNYLLDEYALAGQEADILAHMNGGHGHNLTDYCRHVHDVETQAAEMIGIDPDGFDVRAEGRIWRFDFPTRVTDAQQARSALVELAQSAKTPHTAP
jgi:putative heme iron utilization protein